MSESTKLAEKIKMVIRAGHRVLIRDEGGVLQRAIRVIKPQSDYMVMFRDCDHKLVCLIEPSDVYIDGEKL